MIRVLLIHYAKIKLMSNRLYIQVIDHYEKPRNVGSLDKTSKRVGTGLVGAPACGDVMKLQVRFSFKVISFYTH